MGGSIVLIGFMGAGKSTIGRGLAERLGFRFVDTDRMVIDRAGLSVTQIFRRYGEAGFRERETSVIEEVARYEGAVIATGGGAPTIERNANALKKAGPIVHLDVDIETVRNRTKRSASRRPLLKDRSAKDVAQLLEQRRKIYEDLADLTIDTVGKDTDQVVTEIMGELL